MYVYAFALLNEQSKTPSVQQEQTVWSTGWRMYFIRFIYLFEAGLKKTTLFQYPSAKIVSVQTPQYAGVCPNGCLWFDIQSSRKQYPLAYT